MSLSELLRFPLENYTPECCNQFHKFILLVVLTFKFPFAFYCTACVNSLDNCGSCVLVKINRPPNVLRQSD